LAYIPKKVHLLDESSILERVYKRATLLLGIVRMTDFTDSFTGETKHSNQDPVDEFSTYNSSGPEKLTITPADWSKREIELQKPLLVAMANQNRVEPSDDERTDLIFDEALCDVAEISLQTVGWENNPTDLPKLRALMIRAARDIDTFSNLSSYIDQYSSPEIDQLGLGSTYSTSTYTKKAKSLKKEGRYQSLLEATFVGVHALWWMGVCIPDPTLQKYEISYDAGPDADEFKKGPRDLALYSFVDELIETVVSNLDFQRGENKSRDLRTLIGAFAHAAYTGESIESYDETAGHLFNLDRALSGSTIRYHIDKLNMFEINEMFDDITQALLKYIIESGVVTQPVHISYDQTNIDALEKNDTNSLYLTEDGRWRFVSLSFTDPEIEFAFGLRLLKSESQRADLLKNFLRDLTSMTDVDLLMADREFCGREDFEACREFVPHHWAFHAKRFESKPISDFDKLDMKLSGDDTASIRSVKFEDLSPPVSMIGYSRLTDNGQSIRRFYTDIKIPSDEGEEEDLIRKINYLYNNRSKIETEFGMMKNRLDTSTDTDKDGRKVFYFNISALFYNIYKIVNTVPAPINGLRLDTTQKEILNVIRILSFGGPARRDILSRLEDRS